MHSCCFYHCCWYYYCCCIRSACECIRRPDKLLKLFYWIVNERQESSPSKSHTENVKVWFENLELLIITSNGVRTFHILSKKKGEPCQSTTKDVDDAKSRALCPWNRLWLMLIEECSNNKHIQNAEKIMSIVCIFWSMR